MTISALTPLVRTSSSFVTDVDAFFSTSLPNFVSEANALQADVNAKESDAAASASTATTQAGIATTGADTATTKAAEALASASSASGSAATATAQAATAVANAATASAQNTAAGVSASAAASSASQAATARDAGIAAWVASTAPAENLPAISQTLHYGTIVASCIDLPYLHSDGGAWTDRCTDKSWYKETLGGDRWIGWQASTAAAWSAAGSATGAVFGATATAGPLTSGKFYAATSATTATEVVRGIRRDYPKSGVAWVAESGRVVGYDIGTVGCPMWMVFKTNTGGMDTGFVIGTTSLAMSSLAAKDGVIYVGQSVNSAVGLIRISFLGDYAYGHSANTAYGGYFKGNLSARNSAVGYPWGLTGANPQAIVDSRVNSVAITTLDNEIGRAHV